MSTTTKPIVTADNLRDTAGVGSVINIHHGGDLKRPTETGAKLDKVTKAEIIPKPPELTYNNPAFLDQGSKK